MKSEIGKRPHGERERRGGTGRGGIASAVKRGNRVRAGGKKRRAEDRFSGGERLDAENVDAVKEGNLARSRRGRYRRGELNGMTQGRRLDRGLNRGGGRGLRARGNGYQAEQ